MTKRFGAISTARLDNLTAVVDPTPSDDNTLGYAAGSMWMNLATNAVFFCIDATTSAAVWSDISENVLGTCVMHPINPVLTTGQMNIKQNEGRVGLSILRRSIHVGRVGVSEISGSTDNPREVRVAVYSLDGQTKHIDQVITVAVAGGNGQRTATLSPVVFLPADYYYLFYCRNDAGASQMALHHCNHKTGTGAGAAELRDGPAGSQPDLYGSITISGGVAPSTFDPTAITVPDADTRFGTPLIRFDSA
jgi:hypothetical protein